MAEKKPDSLILVDAHHPPLGAGSYEVTVDQSLSATAGRGVSDTFSTSARFHVLGPRIAVEPGWISARFPAPHSTGDHANVLPHVSLTRSTLPWERDALKGGGGSRGGQVDLPWLAILLLTEDEMAGSTFPPATLHEVSAAELAAGGTARVPAFPGLDEEKGYDADDRVRVLDVPRGVVEPVLPQGSWLPSLCHIKEHLVTQLTNAEEVAVQVAALDREELTPHLRSFLRQHQCPLGPQTKVDVESTGFEWLLTDRETGRTYYLEHDDTRHALDVADEARAAVISCRLTKPGTGYQAFLVSLEGRYQGSPSTFDFGTAASPAALVRFVVLDTWRFAVDSNAGELEHLLHGLVEEILPSGAIEEKGVTLTVPTAGKIGPGVGVLEAGYALLPHHLRRGGHTMSWYRGPLLPRPRDTDDGDMPPLPAVHSDDVLVLDHLYQMFDCSYAAAWELGRYLMVSNREPALDLVAWKGALRRQSHRNMHVPQHLQRPAEEPDRPLPSSVADFVERLSLLDGVPFNYLVPDPAMLPMESLKTFVVDHWWQYYLLDGVASIGRLHDHDRDGEAAALLELHRVAFGHNTTDRNQDFHPNLVSGVLIRSEVVSGWPDLHIEAYHPQSHQILHPLRRAKLSDNVLLLLFEGPLGRVSMHPRPDALHHGLDATHAPSGDIVNPLHLFLASPSAEPLSPAALGWELTKTGPPKLDIYLQPGSFTL